MWNASEEQILKPVKHSKRVKVKVKQIIEKQNRRVARCQEELEQQESEDLAKSGLEVHKFLTLKSFDARPKENSKPPSSKNEEPATSAFSSIEQSADQRLSQSKPQSSTANEGSKRSAHVELIEKRN